MSALVDYLTEFAPTGVAFLGVLAVLILANFVLEKKYANLPENRFHIQVIMIGLTFAGAVVLILILPIGDAKRGQILSLLGVLLSAAIALSSTTLIGNAVAGVLLRALKNFRLGDFIRVGDSFGRVSQRGLFHTEIQTEDRDLTTLPNLYLVSQPVKVIRASGTVVSATVSLGYDVPRKKVEKSLLAAASSADLDEPFVQILELGDFSVSYRIAGLLDEVKRVISVQSLLRAKMLDHLHEAGIEIVSPGFMNTRAIAADRLFIAREEKTREAEDIRVPESLIFDKAEQAESRDRIVEELEKVTKDIGTLENQASKEEDPALRTEMERKKEWLIRRQDQLSQALAHSAKQPDTP